MSAQQLEQDVRGALTGLAHPETGRNMLDSGHVRDLTVSENGDVRFAFFLQASDPGGLVKEARAAVEAIDGVGKVKIDVQLPQTGGAKPAGGGGGLKPGSVPAPTPKPGLLPGVTNIIAVSSGKGGVGKSMVSTNLAAALAGSGQRVGLLDADIYGPNIPLMFGEQRRPSVTGAKGKERIATLESHGVRLMSLGFLLDKEQPAIMRGPLISGILRQFLEQVEWGELDVLIVDMPPGTGDAQLSLVQTIDLDGAVMVTTPQEVSTGDVRRGVKMFERVNTRVLGIVENMAGEIFGSGGGERLAEELGLPFLGRVPLDAEIRKSADAGVPSVLRDPDSDASVRLGEIADQVSTALETTARR